MSAMAFWYANVRLKATGGGGGGGAGPGPGLGCDCCRAAVLPLGPFLPALEASMWQGVMGLWCVQSVIGQLVVTAGRRPWRAFDPPRARYAAPLCVPEVA